jgi:hypothetical protein
MRPELLEEEVARIRNGEIRYFGDSFQEVGDPLDWFMNPFNHRRMDDRRHWSEIADFHRDTGDIKCIWEASRFDWVLCLARAYGATNDYRYLDTLVSWTADWTDKNPPNLGPNWKCGQETSIRLLNTLLALQLIGAPRGGPGLPDFVVHHCNRVSRTLGYALAQDNNHGTSEAAALFVAGAWLARHPSVDRRTARSGERWCRRGRRWLENRVNRLIATDGSFSQYSTNYHRMVLDTLSIVEWWRRRLDEAPFSSGFYTRARAAVDWLYHLVDPISGNVPNIGGNDGARLFRLCDTDYRDYRPTVQLAGVLFLERSTYEPGNWDESLRWLGLDLPKRRADSRRSKVYEDGGYVVLAPPNAPTWGVVRFANFRFRPSQADILHVDIWARGINILRDAGTYSYHGDKRWQSYFPATRAHNTCEFDAADQMPRLSRFLFADWLSMDEIGELSSHDDSRQWHGRYTDSRGASHCRSVRLNSVAWSIIDTLQGYKHSATLRWRLAPGQWRLDEHQLIGDRASIRIEVDGELRRLELVEGWESQYYQKKTPLPVLEIEVAPGAARIETMIAIEH